MSSVGAQELPVFGSIGNEGVCTWYFAMFVLVCGYAGILLMFNLARISMGGMSLSAKAGILLLALLVTAFMVANAGFSFTMCKRALIG